jgi:hypothetical protein
MKIPNPFSPPSPLDVAAKQLRLAQLNLLEAHGALEAAKGHVRVLEERVARLKVTVQAYSETPAVGNEV